MQVNPYYDSAKQPSISTAEDHDYQHITFEGGLYLYVDLWKYLMAVINSLALASQSELMSKYVGVVALILYKGYPTHMHLCKCGFASHAITS